MRGSMMSHILYRPVWNALSTRQAHLAMGDQTTALRFVPDINIFGGTPDNTPDQLLALGALTPKDGGAAIVERHRIVPPDGLIAMIEEPVHQMSAPRIAAPDTDLD